MLRYASTKHCCLNQLWLHFCHPILRSASDAENVASPTIPLHLNLAVEFNAIDPFSLLLMGLVLRERNPHKMHEPLLESYWLSSQRVTNFYCFGQPPSNEGSGPVNAAIEKIMLCYHTGLKSTQAWCKQLRLVHVPSSWNGALHSWSGEWWSDCTRYWEKECHIISSCTVNLADRKHTTIPIELGHVEATLLWAIQLVVSWSWLRWQQSLCTLAGGAGEQGIRQMANNVKIPNFELSVSKENKYSISWNW